MQLDERTGFAVIAAGALISAIGGIWLLLRAFRQGIGWGLAVLLIPLLGALAFLLCHVRKAIGPVLVMVLGGLVGGVPVMLNVLNAKVVTEAKVEQKQDEIRVTLTGVARDEYAKLAATPDVAVLQWANPDVTDADAAVLKDLKNLRELDLNGTQITDATLDTLAALPKLKSLRIARTKITDEAFKAKLQPLEGFEELDLTGTAVKAGTGRAWKAAKPGRKLLQ